MSRIKDDLSGSLLKVKTLNDVQLDLELHPDRSIHFHWQQYFQLIIIDKFHPD